MQTVLAVGAHPDDVEMQCAGTLALLVQRGWRAVIATMTPGDLGSATLPRDEIAQIRRDEAQRSATVIDAGYRCLELRDLTIVFGDEACRRVTALLREVQPNLVLTHAPRDYLADHEETSRIVRHACFAAPVPSYSADGLPATDAIAPLYYFDPMEGIDMFGQPAPVSVIVDISTTIGSKTEMLGLHSSQREWLRVQHGCDHYLEQMRRWSCARGQLAQCDYGEAFAQHVGHPYPKHDSLADELGQLAHRRRPDDPIPLRHVGLHPVSR